MFPYWPRTVENRAALRTAISALVAILIAFKFHLPNPYWSGMSVVIVTNLYTGSIIDKAMMRITGTILGAVLGFYIAGIVANSFFLYLLSCFLIIAVSVYYYYYSKHGYAYLLGALCAFIIISQIVIDPGNAFQVAIWRPVEIGIGVLVFALGVYVIFPNHLKDNITIQLNDLFDNLVKEVQELARCIDEQRPDMHHVAVINLKIKKELRKAIDLLGALNRELGIEQLKTDELRAFLDSFFSFSRQIQYLITIPYTSDDINFLRCVAVNKVFNVMAQDLRQLQAGLSAASPSLVLHTGTELEELEKRIHELAKTPRLHSDFIFSLLVFFNQAHESFIFLQSLLLKNPLQQKKQNIILTKKDRIRADNTLIKHGVKAGLAVLLALGFWLVSNWPGGINGIISSLIISLRLNLLEMKNVIAHRLIGCMLGGGLALSSLAVIRMNLYDFLVIIFFAVWGFTYFMFKYPKYSYIGLQANIALIIALAQAGGPPTLLDPPLQRLAGVVIGIVASFIVANVLWRSDIWSILHSYLRKIYKYMNFNLQQILLVQGQKTIHDLGSLFWMVRGLIESLTELQLNSKKQNRLHTVREQFEALVMIQATINYILVSINKEQAAATASFFGLDLARYEQQLVDVYTTENHLQAKKLADELKNLSVAVRTNPLCCNIDLASLRNILAYLNALKQLALSLNANNKLAEIQYNLKEQLLST